MKDRLAERAGTALLWKAAHVGGAQIVSLLRTLVLARLLVPDDFGLMAMAVLTVHTLISLTDLGMVPALIQRGDEQETLYDAAWTVGLLRSTAIAVCVVAAAPAVAMAFKEERATTVIQVLALRPLIEGLFSIRMAALARKLRFRSLAVISLTGVLVDAFVAIGLATRLGVWALVFGVLAGALASLVASYVLAPYRPRLIWDLEAVRPLIRFGRWILLTGVLAVAGSAILQLVISRRLGAASLGLYFLAVKLAFLPGEVTARVVGEVTFPVFARLQSEPQAASRAFRSILVGMSALLLPAYALLIVLAPSIVHNLLGERWQGTAPLIRILATAGLIGLFGDAAGPVFKGVGRPERVAILEGLQSLLMIALVWWLAGSLGLEGAASAWLPALMVSQVVAAGFLRQSLPRPFTGLRRPLLAIGLATALGALTALALDHVIPGMVGLPVALLAAMALMGFTLLKLDRRYELGMRRDLLQVFPQLALILPSKPGPATNEGTGGSP